MTTFQQFYRRFQIHQQRQWHSTIEKEKQRREKKRQQHENDCESKSHTPDKWWTILTLWVMIFVDSIIHIYVKVIQSYAIVYAINCFILCSVHRVFANGYCFFFAFIQLLSSSSDLYIIFYFSFSISLRQQSHSVFISLSLTDTRNWFWVTDCILNFIRSS